MGNIILLKHRTGAPGLRILGMGPNLQLLKGMNQLKNLLNYHAEWSHNRDMNSLKKMLSNSQAISSLWSNKELIGFGRATSDSIYRAILWDIVIKDKWQRKGYGKKIINSLLENKVIKSVERVYLMTTNQASFYSQFGFRKVQKQVLMKLENDIHL